MSKNKLIKINNKNFQKQGNLFNDYDDEYPNIRHNGLKHYNKEYYTRMQPVDDSVTKMKLFPHTFETKVLVATKVPTITISKIALVKMWQYIDIEEREIGWLGRVVKQDDVYNIIDVFLFSQEVTGTTTEIDEGGLASFTVETMRRLGPEEGIKFMDSIRFWGHSHVNMGTSPSGQDERQLQEFMNNNPWFIRGIGNKRGRLEFTIFDSEHGLIYNDVKWQMEDESYPPIRAAIREEISTKVRGRTYSSFPYSAGSSTNYFYCPTCKTGKNYQTTTATWINGEATRRCDICQSKVIDYDQRFGNTHKDKSNIMDDISHIGVLVEKDGKHFVLHSCHKGNEPKELLIENCLYAYIDDNAAYFCPTCGALVYYTSTFDRRLDSEYSTYTTVDEIEELRITFEMTVAMSKKTDEKIKGEGKA